MKRPLAATAALLADSTGALSLVSVPPPELPPPTRFVLRYGVMICTT